MSRYYSVECDAYRRSLICARHISQQTWPSYLADPISPPPFVPQPLPLPLAVSTCEPDIPLSRPRGHSYFCATNKVFCTSEGIVCGGVGTCVDFGCVCDSAGEGAGGDFCTADQADSESAGTRTVALGVSLVAAVTAVTTAFSAVLVLGTPLSSSLLS